MSHDKATVDVKCDHIGIVSDVEDLVSELDTPDSFGVTVLGTSPGTQGSGSDGSKIVTVEVHEYAGEIPLFTESVREQISGATIDSVEVETGESRFN